MPALDGLAVVRLGELTQLHPELEKLGLPIVCLET
jgi:hypothetical protein